MSARVCIRQRAVILPLRLYYAPPASAVNLGLLPTGGSPSPERAPSTPCKAGAAYTRHGRL